MTRGNSAKTDPIWSVVVKPFGVMRRRVNRDGYL